MEKYMQFSKIGQMTLCDIENALAEKDMLQGYLNDYEVQLEDKEVEIEALKSNVNSLSETIKELREFITKNNIRSRTIDSVDSD